MKCKSHITNLMLFYTNMTVYLYQGKHHPSSWERWWRRSQRYEKLQMYQRRFRWSFLHGAAGQAAQGGCASSVLRVSSPAMLSLRSSTWPQLSLLPGLGCRYSECPARHSCPGILQISVTQCNQLHVSFNS